MVELKIDNNIYRYPFVDSKEQLTEYEPHIIVKTVNGATVVDLVLNVSNINQEMWLKIQECMVMFKLEEPTYKLNAFGNGLTGIVYGHNHTTP
jgi:hypothetical protein